MFSKISDTEYLLKEPRPFIEQADQVFKLIHGNDLTDFEPVTSKELYNSILSRIVAVEFLKKGMPETSTNFVNIRVKAKDEEILCVAGTLVLNDKCKKTSGVLYK